MEYTDREKRIISEILKMDYKKIKTNEDTLFYTQKLSELRPEVATHIIDQFPELANVIKSSIYCYKDIIEKELSSDDESVSRVYDTFDKVIDNAAESRQQFYNTANIVLNNINMCLNNPNFTPEQHFEMLKQQVEILQMVDAKDSEIRNSEMEMADKASQKDSEKKKYHWQIIGGACLTIIATLGWGKGHLDDIINKLPKKS